MLPLHPGLCWELISLWLLDPSNAALPRRERGRSPLPSPPLANTRLGRPRPAPSSGPRNPSPAAWPPGLSKTLRLTYPQRVGLRISLDGRPFPGSGSAPRLVGSRLPDYSLLCSSRLFTGPDVRRQPAFAVEIRDPSAPPRRSHPSKCLEQRHRGFFLLLVLNPCSRQSSIFYISSQARGLSSHPGLSKRRPSHISRTPVQDNFRATTSLRPVASRRLSTSLRAGHTLTSTSTPPRAPLVLLQECPPLSTLPTATSPYSRRPCPAAATLGPSAPLYILPSSLSLSLLCSSHDLACRTGQGVRPRAGFRTTRRPLAPSPGRIHQRLLPNEIPPSTLSGHRSHANTGDSSSTDRDRSGGRGLRASFGPQDNRGRWVRLTRRPGRSSAQGQHRRRHVA